MGSDNAELVEGACGLDLKIGYPHHLDREWNVWKDVASHPPLVQRDCGVDCRWVENLDHGIV